MDDAEFDAEVRELAVRIEEQIRANEAQLEELRGEFEMGEHIRHAGVPPVDEMLQHA